MTDQIRPPWTPQQVAALNQFQRRGGMHPFTCGHEHPAHPNPILEATKNGWRCYVLDCEYEQNWAHAFMAEPGAWPQPLADLRRAAGTEASEASCCCGEPETGGVIHRTDGPCHIAEPEPSDPTQCSGEEGFCPEHGFHRHGLKRPAEQSARTTPDDPATSNDGMDNSLREQIAAAARTVQLRLGPNAIAMAQRGEPIILSGGEADQIADAALAAVEEHLDVGEEHAWCKTCRRVWEGPHHRCESDAEQAVTRVTDLYERWVKAGLPPLGVSLARWQDRRLVELRDAIRPTTDTSREPDETLDYGTLPPPAADPDAPLRTGVALPPTSDGPSVREAANDDRRWDAEKAGEA